MINKIKITPVQPRAGKGSGECPGGCGEKGVSGGKGGGRKEGEGIPGGKGGAGEPAEGE